MYNRIVLVGNLTKDIELRYSQSGKAIANSAIATTRKFSNNGEKKEDVCFVDVTFFGRSGEVANQYLRKGSKVLIEGRLNFEQWTDKDANKRSKHNVIVESMQMLDSKPSNETQQQGSYPPDVDENGYGYGGRRYAPPPPQQQVKTPPPVYYENAQGRQVPPPQRQMPKNPTEIDIDDEDIPF